MGYVVRHSTSNVNKSRRKGNVAIGTDADGYDKTSVSGFYAGVAPVEGKNNLVRTSASGDPDFYALDDTELINFANSLGGSVSNKLTAKQYLLTRDDIIFTDELPNDIVTDNLVIDLDASIESSFLDNKPTVNLLEQSGASSLPYRTDIYNNVIKTNLGGGKYRFQNDGTGSTTIRLYCNLDDLEDGETYACSVSYENFNSGNGSSLTLDWCDVENTQFTGESGRASMSASRGTYDSTYRFFDISIPVNASIILFDAQVEKGAEATPYVNGTRTQNTTWYDLSGNSDNVTSINGTTFDPEKGFRFDGTDDYMQINSTVDLGNPCTVTALVNVESVGSYTIYGPSANGHDNWLGTNGTQLEMFGTQTADTNNFTVRGNSLVCDGTRWHHVACTIDGATAKVWIDGNEKNSTTRAFEIGGWDSTAGLGRRGFISQRYFPGRIAKVQGYSKALSSDEMKQNYYQADIVTDGLVLAMDVGNLVSYESGSTTAYSLTGSIYSGSLTNGVSFSSNNGGTWDFDGSNDIISIPTYTFGNGDWSLSVWANTDSTSNYNIMSNSSGGPVTNAFGFHGGNIFYRNYNGTWQNNSGNTTLSTGEWYLLTWVNYGGATAQDGTMKMFVNGVPDSGVFNSYTTNGGPCNAIGRNWFSYYNGKIANIYIQTKSLSDEEVFQNYNAQKTRFL
jgi:hypothetical protein